MARKTTQPGNFDRSSGEPINIEQWLKVIAEILDSK